MSLVSAPPRLGTAGNFAVLAASAVTCTNTSTVTGDLGVSPGTAITGFNSDCTVNGVIHGTDTVAALAHDDLVTAYIGLAAAACDFNLTGQDLGNMNLVPGTYCFDSSAGLTGQLTLNGAGNPDAVWIFQVATALTTGSGSSVVMVANGQPCNVFWQVGTSATLGTGTVFVGNIAASASITLVTSASLTGRALALNAAVTMDHNQVSMASCSASTGGTGGGSGGGGGDGGTGGGTGATGGGTGGGCEDEADGGSTHGGTGGGTGGCTGCPAGTGGGTGGSGGVCEGREWVTGAGSLNSSSTCWARSTFSLSGGIKNNAYFGAFSFRENRWNGLRVTGTGVTSYVVVDATTRRIGGTATLNGQSGFTYVVDVSDQTALGGSDTFSLVLSNGYTASGPVSAGNIRFHVSPGHAGLCNRNDDGDDDGGDDDDNGHGHGHGGQDHGSSGNNHGHRDHGGRGGCTEKHAH